MLTTWAVLLYDSPAHAQTTQTLTVNLEVDPDSRPEPGGNFTFTATVTNNDSVAVTVTSASDDVGSILSICSSATISAGGSITCTFTRSFTGDAGDTDTNTVTVTAVPSAGGSSRSDADSVTVSITDGDGSGDDVDITVDVTASPTSRQAPGGSFTYTVRVENVGSENVVLTTLTEDGSSLDGRGTCDTGVTINVDQTFTCTFSEDFTGSNGASKTTTVSATARDVDDANDTDTATDSVTVTISADGTGTEGFTVTKTASPTSRVVPGGTFTFSIVVTNNTGSSVTLNTLQDSVHGNLDGRGTCDVPQTIANGSSYSCQFSIEFTGNTVRTETNTVTASGTRSGGTSVSDTDTETITITGGLGTGFPLSPFNPLSPFIGQNPFLPIGSTGDDDGRGPIVITNNNSSSSSSSAAASAGGGTVVAAPPPTTTQPTLVRTGVEALPMAAGGMAILLLGLVLNTAGNRRLALQSNR